MGAEAMCGGCGEREARLYDRWYYTDSVYVLLCKRCQRLVGKRFVAFVKEVCQPKKGKTKRRA
jgi:hypothetical protein